MRMRKRALSLSGKKRPERKRKRQRMIKRRGLNRKRMAENPESNQRKMTA